MSVHVFCQLDITEYDTTMQTTSSRLLHTTDHLTYTYYVSEMKHMNNMKCLKPYVNKKKQDRKRATF